jgi:hypothetical protein
MADDHASLSDDELAERLRRQRRESAEWAAALAEVQRRGDHLRADERFREALAHADDGPKPGAGADTPPEPG